MPTLITVECAFVLVVTGELFNLFLLLLIIIFCFLQRTNYVLF